MRFKDYSVVKVLVGLHRIGIIGLSEALTRAEESGLQDREAIIDMVIEHLAPRNYIPESQIETLRNAVWREYLRRQGRDFSGFYSEVQVIIRGDAGEERDRFVDLVTSVLAEFELRPAIIECAPAPTDDPNPQLEISGETLIRGMPSRGALKKALHQSLSDW